MWDIAENLHRVADGDIEIIMHVALKNKWALENYYYYYYLLGMVICNTLVFVFSPRLDQP